MLIYPHKLLGEYFLTEEIFLGNFTLVYRVLAESQNTETSTVIHNLLRLTFNKIILFRARYSRNKV